MNKYYIIGLVLLSSCFELDNNKNKEKNYTLEKEVISVEVIDTTGLKELQNRGIFGRWECNYSGYESVIELKQKNGKYTSFIDFDSKYMSDKTEDLVKRNADEYGVKGSDAGEYYVINEDGNLELWDNKGYWTTATNIFPGTQSKYLELDLAKVIGKDIYSIAGTYSKSAPQTLEGTNSELWIVYYKDIDVTFRVDKKTDKIESAKKGN